MTLHTFASRKEKKYRVRKSGRGVGKKGKGRGGRDMLYWKQQASFILATGIEFFPGTGEVWCRKEQEKCEI